MSDAPQPDPTPAPTPEWLTQFYTALRYIGTGAGTLGTVAALLSIVDQQTAHNIVNALQKVTQDLIQLGGDATTLVYLVIPVVTVWLARIGVKSSSNKSAVARVQSLPSTQVLTTDKALAMAVPGVIHTETLPLPTPSTTQRPPSTR
jgi:hypothetical protein